MVAGFAGAKRHLFQRSTAGVELRAQRQVSKAVAVVSVLAVAATSLLIGQPLWADTQQASSTVPVQCEVTEPSGREVLDYQNPEGVTDAPATPEAALEAYLDDGMSYLSADDFSAVHETATAVEYALAQGSEEKVVVNVSEYADGWRVFSSWACIGFLDTLRRAK